LVDEHVLIPRFETETLVRRVIQDTKSSTPDILIDVGTGSGIIPISISKNTSISTVYALDISEGALDIAKRNAVRNAVQIQFYLSNLFQYFIENLSLLSQKNIVVTANLPYIKNDDWETMSPDTHFEPQLALFGGETTGFELYDKFFEQIRALMEVINTKGFIIYLEMGFDQKHLAIQACEKNGWICELFPDARGIERFAKIIIV
jgi:release factor glutamine methyltransferase